MASQLQSVSSTGEGEDAFTMKFSFDVETNVQKMVEHMAYKSTLGQFRAAREISDSISKGQAKIFPIAFEILRLLYDQGHYVQLRKTIQQIKAHRPPSSPKSSKTYRGWSVQELEIFELMERLAIASTDAISTFQLLDRRPIVAVEGRLSRLRPDDLDDEHAIVSVVLLRLKYLDHEVVRKLPSESFEVLSGVSPPELVSRLLEAEYFWAAENILEVCFRRDKDPHQKISLESIWAAVARFLDDPGDEPDESRTWAQIGILQSFCEGCLRRGLVEDKIEIPNMISWSWDIGMSTLARLISIVQTEQEEDAWTHSRASIRQEILELDHQIWQQVQIGTPDLKEDVILKLIGLTALACENDDVRYKAGILWRAEVLVGFTNPQAIPAPREFTAVPFDTYLARHKSLDQLAAGKVRALHSIAQDVGKPLMEGAKSSRITIAVALFGQDLEQEFWRRERQTPVGRGSTSPQMNEVVETDKALVAMSIENAEKLDEVKIQKQQRDREPEAQKLEGQRNKTQDAERLQMEIDTMEVQAGWSPRVIVHNRSSVLLHLRVLSLTRLGKSIFNGDVAAGELRAIRCGPETYQLEAFLIGPGNQLSISDTGSLSSVASGAHVGLPFPAEPSLNSGTPFEKHDMKANFDSSTADGEQASSRISSSVPIQFLPQEVKRQMRVMAMTLKEEQIRLFQTSAFQVVGCTRLEIRGGPRCIRHEDYVQYDFEAKTKPLRAEMVDKFTANT